ncbi:zinc finger protein 91 [Contarinia nasturtii]|uniref:zinc finger protein 91 n=1 Tax=Contarinia nasturtii TaxID=265458 RepID=UPI0012D40EC7|nr:zinc finger protein 91 [Contarinia nasturtii]
MLEDLDEDTHLCIKCSHTIVGLENYVRHRKSQCNKSVSSAASLNREIDTNHSYRSFEFTEPPSVKHDKQFNFNYEIESVHPDHEDSHDVVSNTGILPSPMHQSEKASDYKIDPNKSLSESYDYNYGLGADVFFSLLNLQSSTKSKTQTVATNVSADGSTSASSLIKGTDKMLQRKQSDPGGLSHSEHMDDWINTGASTSGTDKLMKAVNAISGNKKHVYDSPQYNYEYTHGSPPDHNFDDDDDEIVEDLVEDVEDIPPHTGGKWKPSERHHRSMQSASRWYERWDIPEENNQLALGSVTTGSHEELVDNSDEYNPPPTHTKGKWVPGTKIIKLDYKHKERHDSETFSEQFWCRSCNRKLSSKIVYERHLKSKLHTKRSQPENELEQVSLPLPSIEHIVGKKSTNFETQTNRKRKRKDEIAYITEHSFDANKKRTRKRNYIKCGVCKMRLRTFLYGKHLISHYHYRRMFKNPTESYATILDNMNRIVLQSPYQCQPCRFYANTEEMFLRHWDSNEHLVTVSDLNGRFWCAFCKFQCITNDEMRLHLVGMEHQEVVMAINRSVPIICRKKCLIQCEKCKEEFSLNIELRKHAMNCTDSRAVGTASDQYQGKYYCSDCNEYYCSIVAFQKHTTIVHSTKSYFCGPCELSFSELEAAKRHRVSVEHKVKAARIKAKKSLKRKCIVCGEMQDDLLLLKEHLKFVHPDHSYSCYFCGQKFILPQELSRHIRDKVCKTDDRTPNEDMCHESDSLNPMSLLELPIITDITQDVEVTKLVVAQQNDQMTVDTSVTVESLVPDDYVIIEHGAELNLDEDPRGEAEHSVLWGCKQCDFRTQYQAECIFHEMLHKWNICNDSKMPCPMCNRTFGKNSLRMHLRMHTNERIFKCDQCDMKFTRKANLKEHIQRIHLKMKKSKPNKPSSTAAANRLKQKSSSSPYSNEQQLFGCSICEKRFRKKSLLEQHMHCHREMITVRSFKCPEQNCLFSGRSAAELRVHKSTHSNEKNYCCTVENCDYRTKTNALLNRHIKSQHQTDVIQLLCPHCDFRTKISSHLKRHIRTHTGEKPYQCPHCDYVSNNPENLRKHVINTNKHPGRFLYECKLCTETNEDQPFATNNTKEYKCHLVSIHNQKK